MKKQRITFFGLRVAVGIVITMLCIVIMRESDNQTDFVKETTHTQDTKNHETVSDIKVEEISDTETEENSSNYAVTNAENQEIKSIHLKDENGEFTPEALELAKKYLTKYNNGEWDGTEMHTYNGHIIKLDEGGGYLLLDGYIAVGQRNLDIPESAYKLFRNDIPDYEYVPGQGTYVIIDKKLVKFLRGEQITLPGEELSWKGFQDKDDLYSKTEIDYRIMYDLPTLIYNKIDGKLYLTSGDETCTLDNSENYVYVFDDYNVSNMRYLGRVNFEHEYPGNVDMNSLIANSK